ncbi:MAG: TPM domain-containing protein [Aquincola sp.]|nr:TPM domain-containing protein [Aquincola sp.]MDH4289207.1 TPM domain-containing protein [Aquincola sp.]MDH5331566.1 TPM domain-containing protein [Aquincola sp.]
MPRRNRLHRIVKHRWLDEGDVRRALDEAAVKRIEERVAASERRHSGEIRVCVEAGLPWSYLWKRLTARDRAITMFGKLRVWDTAANNGVLIYLLLAEHAIEIVADRGLNAHVSHEQWQTIVAGMREAFRAGRFEEGLHAAIDAVDRLLAAHFPLAAGTDNPNELPNKPWVG